MEMEKMKRYIDCYVPTETCNLRCHYCYIAQLKKFNNKIAKFDKSPEYISKALSKERLGGVCLLNICAGGETLISDEVIPVVEALLKEGHYVMIVTNGTISIRFQEIVKLDKDLLERLFFKFSFHYLELRRINKLDEFFANIKKIEEAGCSYTVEITPSDELIPHIEEIKKISLEKLNSLPHITIARDDRTDKIEHLSKYNFADYKKIWETFDSKLFKFKGGIFYEKRKEFCYAGDWSAYLNLNTGDLRQCYCGKKLQNIYENINEPIRFEAIGNNCSLPHCYNGHSFLALGAIPSIDLGNYAELRQRKTNDSDVWVKAKMENFMKSKLKYSNSEYTRSKKIIINLKNKIPTIFRKVKRKLR